MNNETAAKIYVLHDDCNGDDTCFWDKNAGIIYGIRMILDNRCDAEYATREIKDFLDQGWCEVCWISEAYIRG